MRSRRHRHEEHENHERWLVSYADFITLLFAFFVVMYAISSVNEGKYRVLSNSLEQAFSKNSAHFMDPVEGEVPMHSRDPNDRKDPPDPIANGSNSAIDLGGSGSPDEPPEPAQDEPKDNATILRELNEALQPLIDKDQVALRDSEKGVEIEMKSNVLFASGRADLTRAAGPLLKEIGTQLLSFSNPVTVQGFTDNQPISNALYASNWELSAARAAVVANLLNKTRIHTDRLTAVGLGENQPIGDNKSAEGRQRNRRVVMLIASSPGSVHGKARNKASAGATPPPENARPWEKIAIEGPAAAAQPESETTQAATTSGKATARVNKPK